MVVRRDHRSPMMAGKRRQLPQMKPALAVIFSFALWAFGYTVFAGSALAVESELPERIDVVFTFGGNAARTNWSRTLVRRCHCLWLLGATRDVSRDGSRQHDGPGEVELLFDNHSTFQEVEALHKRLAEGVRGKDGKDPLSVALVSDAYHMRRIKLTVERVFEGSAVRFSYLPVPAEFDVKERRNLLDADWWRHEILWREAAKNLYYFLHAYRLPFGKDD